MTTIETIHQLAIALERNARYALKCDEGYAVFEKEIENIIKELNEIIK